MRKPLRIGIAGLGTVGAGVVKVIARHGDLLRRRCGRQLVVTAVSARDRIRDRGIDLAGIDWHDDARALASADNVDVVVEVIGGEDGIALDLSRTALAGGKHVITANKAMIAHHGTELARLSEEKGAGLNYEAAVAGGIPIVKALREGLAANRIDRVYGILNGTCNYILTRMEETGQGFADVLAEAQALGYAEADPGFDVGGIDAAHKLAILVAAAFGTRVDFAALPVEGIEAITAEDIDFAGELGYRIKLLGLARRGGDAIQQRVHPCMVPLGTPISDVDDVFNAVVIEGDFVGPIMLEGRGAGAGPTASAIVADILDIARGLRLPAFGIPAADLQQMPIEPLGERRGPNYLRLIAIDRPGVIAGVAAALANHGISIETMLQRGQNPGEAVPVVLITHDCVERDLDAALTQIEALDAVTEPPHRIRIVRP